MPLHVMSCPSCSAQIQFPPGARVTTCAYCGAQVTLDPAPRPAVPVLAEGLSLKVLPTTALELIKTGSMLPASVTQTLASQSDDQTEMHLNLQAGADPDPARNRDLPSITYSLSQRRPRGMPAVQLKVTVAQTGEVSVEMREEGTTNTRHYDAGRLAVRAAQ